MLEYAEEHWRLYHDILWVSASQTDLLPFEFARIAVELGVIPEVSDDPQADARKALKELETGPRRLLILDNAADELSTQNWLPTSGKAAPSPPPASLTARRKCSRGMWTCLTRSLPAN